MPEKPILFSGPMVRAILEGRKTQTRRVMRLEPGGDGYGLLCRAGRYIEVGAYGPTWVPVGSGPRELCPRDVWMQYAAYQVGDILWVRETWSPWCCVGTEFVYRADCDRAIRWRPSIFMPRWASRITLEVTDVRVQRLLDISEEDALAEGVPTFPSAEQPPSEDGIGREWCRSCGGTLLAHNGSDCYDCNTPRKLFLNLWDHINEARGHGRQANDWVFAYTFRKVEQ